MGEISENNDLNNVLKNVKNKKYLNLSDEKSNSEVKVESNDESNDESK